MDATGAVGGIEVTQAELTVTLGDITRTYGTLKPAEGGYNITSVAGMTNGDDENALTIGGIADSALESAFGEARTKDAGEYEWRGVLDGVAKVNQNYDIAFLGGKSLVKQKLVGIGELWAKIVYGDQGGRGLTVDEEASLSTGSIVYGDDVELVFGGTYSVTGEYEDNKGSRTTADVGRYANSLKADGLILSGSDAGNYKLEDTEAHGGIEVTQAALTVTLSDVSHTYGSPSLTNGTSYGIAGVSGSVNGDGYTAADLTVGAARDGALVYDGVARRTRNAGKYAWSAGVTSNAEKLNRNYRLEVKDGISTVNKANMVIELNDVSTVYGTAFDESEYGYTFGDGAGLVNGDTSDILGVLSYANSAAKDGSGGVWTADAGRYDGAVNLTSVPGLANYEVTVNKGAANVGRAALAVKADDLSVAVGGTPVYTGTDIAGVLVNGDTLEGFTYRYGAEDGSVVEKAGVYADAIGVWAGDVFYNENAPEWGGVFANYNVSLAPGTLTVTGGGNPPTPPHVDPGTPFAWIHQDGWDKILTFRERKGEVNFRNGGMSVSPDA